PTERNRLPVIGQADLFRERERERRLALVAFEFLRVRITLVGLVFWVLLPKRNVIVCRRPLIWVVARRGQRCTHRLRGHQQWRCQEPARKPCALFGAGRERVERRGIHLAHVRRLGKHLATQELRTTELLLFDLGPEALVPQKFYDRKLAIHGLVPPARDACESNRPCASTGPRRSR